jgi:hypothetical protein
LIFFFERKTNEEKWNSKGLPQPEGLVKCELTTAGQNKSAKLNPSLSVKNGFQ